MIGRFACFPVAANSFFKHSRLLRGLYRKPMGFVVRVCVPCAVVAVAVVGSLGEAVAQPYYYPPPQRDYYNAPPNSSSTVRFTK